MTDLPARILARVAQLEALARAADEEDVADSGVIMNFTSAHTEHIRAFDPAFALALCAGVRQLLQGHEPERDMAGRGPVCTSCSEHGENLWPCGHLLTVARMVGVDPDGATPGAAG